MNASQHDPQRPLAPLVIAILGGVAAGKSQAARLLAGSDGVHVDADALSRELLESPEGLAWLEANFGRELLDPKGLPERGALAERVFSDPEARELLEGWIHPRVRARILECLEQARASGVPRLVLDVPLLLENEERHGLLRRCDVLIFVDSDPQTRDARAQATRGWKPGEVALREATQLPLDEKRTIADHVISNDGSPEELAHAVRVLLDQLEPGPAAPL